MKGSILHCWNYLSSYTTVLLTAKHGYSYSLDLKIVLFNWRRICWYFSFLVLTQNAASEWWGKSGTVVCSQWVICFSKIPWNYFVVAIGLLCAMHWKLNIFSRCHLTCVRARAGIRTQDSMISKYSLYCLLLWKWELLSKIAEEDYHSVYLFW